MKLLWTERGWSEYLHWQENDPKLVGRVNELLRDVRRSPFLGIGKPEPLGNQMSGWWSRRIDKEHRLVYRVTGKSESQAIEITSCRFHYGRR